MNKTVKVSVNFSNIKKLNPLFSQCSIRVLYDGMNRNNSLFTKDVVNQNVYSIFNIPIVGEYLEESDNFGGHGGKIEIKDKKVELVHTTKPYGLVPESATIYWEEVTEENGDKHDYLVVDDALLWTGRYPEVEQLIGQEFGQSMEVEINKGKFKRVDGQDTYVVDDFIFSALCILGIDKESDPNGHVEPCFESASIVAYTLNSDEFKAEYKKMLEDVKQFNLLSPSLEDDIEQPQQDQSQQKNMQGGNKVDEILAMLETYSVTLEDLQAKGINHEEFSLEDLEEKVKVEFKVEDKQDDKSNDIPDDKFALTVSQLRGEVYRALSEFGTIVEDWDGYKYEYQKYSLEDIVTESGHVVAYDNENWYLVGFSYTVEGDQVKVAQDSMKRFKVDYVPMDIESDEVPSMFEGVKSQFEKVKELFSIQKEALNTKSIELEELQSRFTALETEHATVNAEYSAKLDAERKVAEDEIFTAFAKELTEDEMSEVVASKDGMELDEIQDKLFALVGKKKAKFNFSAQEKTKVIDLKEMEPEKDKAPARYGDLFERY